MTAIEQTTARRRRKLIDAAILFGAGVVSGFLGSAALRESCHGFWTDPACVPEPGWGAAVKAAISMGTLLLALVLAQRVTRDSDEMIRMIDLQGWRLSAWIATGVLGVAGVLEVALPDFDVPALLLALVLLIGHAVGRTLVGWRYGATDG